MNFHRDVIEAAPGEERALVELSRSGERREWTFAQVADASARAAGTLVACGVGRGDVVATLIGSRAEWVLTMLACFRLGAVAFPCNEQLRAGDLRPRLEATRPALVVADERNRAELEGAAPACDVLLVPGEELTAGQPAPAAELDGEDPCLIVYTSGTAGAPTGVVHAQRYLTGQSVQARHWLDPRRGELVWSTAATGWSKSARNVFIAPWLCGAAALVHDARFDPSERLELLERERVEVLCMAPTEYRVIAGRAAPRRLPALRALLAAGEPLEPEVAEAWREATGVAPRDGYGQTETGHLTAIRPGDPPRPGSMGRPLPGFRVWLDDGELVVDPASVPTFFRGHVDGTPAPSDPWRTGDRVRADEDGYLYFEGRADDLIISAGYRIGPFEVESALVSHPAVVEAAAVAAPDPERGTVVRAVVVLADGAGEGDAALARELQEHVKRATAPYKYPRIVEFVSELPKTASGKLRRAALREDSGH